jgi:hypothetical protein
VRAARQRAKMTPVRQSISISKAVIRTLRCERPAGCVATLFLCVRSFLLDMKVTFYRHICVICELAKLLILRPRVIEQNVGGRVIKAPATITFVFELPPFALLMQADRAVHLLRKDCGRVLSPSR